MENTTKSLVSKCVTCFSSRLAVYILCKAKASRFSPAISLFEKQTNQSDSDLLQKHDFKQFQALHSKSKHFSNLESTIFKWIKKRISSTRKNPEFCTYLVVNQSIEQTTFPELMMEVTTEWTISLPSHLCWEFWQNRSGICEKMAAGKESEHFNYSEKRSLVG